MGKGALCPWKPIIFRCYFQPHKPFGAEVESDGCVVGSFRYRALLAGKPKAGSRGQGSDALMVILLIIGLVNMNGLVLK